MKYKRMVSLLLTAILLINVSAPALAHEDHRQPETEGVRRVTVTFSADIIPGKITPVKRRDTQMVDKR